MIWIFTIMEVLFFITGAIFVASLWMLCHVHRKYPLTPQALVSAGTGIFLLLFCILWSVSSLAEGEMRSSAMGIVVFGTPGVICLAAARQMVSRRQERVPETEI